MDQQQRNLIIAIVLSVAIMFGFQFLMPQAQHKVPPPPPAGDVTANGQPATQGAAGTPTAGTTALPAPAASALATIAPREEVLPRTARVAIDAPQVQGTINLTGARLDDLTLVNYHETADPQSPAIVLLAPDGTTHPYIADFGWAPAATAGVKLPDETTQWTSSGGDLTPDHPVDLTWDNGGGLRFTRHFAIDDHYMFTVTETVQNDTDAPVSLAPYGRITRIGDVPVSAYSMLHVGPLAVLNGTLHDGGWWAAPDKYNYKDVKQAPVTDTTTGGWLGFTDKYWLTALIPEQQAPATTEVDYRIVGNRDLYQSQYRGGEHVVAPKSSATVEQHFFAGAKQADLLGVYETKLNIPEFDHAIDFGILYFITKPIFLALDFFYKWLGNFGLAILLLTFLIKAAFFPLANRSYRAMGKMKKLQPEMQKLRERFGEDKERLNQEMMALYKRVGANPLAGCLPIFIQIPVFWSLYKVLYVTIEMRNAPFYGWIHDLSSPDPTSFVNLFGLIPMAVPAVSFLHIGAWPLVMGVTMFLQQRLNPAPPDPVQAKMFLALPFVFTFMLSQMPAGLVIYWTWNNLLTIAQQWTIMRQANAS